MKDTVIRRLTKQIIQDMTDPASGLLPGVQLVEQLLIQRYKASRATIRVVLNILESKGLVTNIPNRGKFVRKFSDKEIEDMYDLRALLEGCAARLAASRITKDKIKKLGNLLIDLEREEKRGVDEGLIEKKDLKFHQYIQKVCGNDRLDEMLKESHIQFYLIKIFRPKTGNFYKKSISHREIFDAIRFRNYKKAEIAARMHVELSKK